MVVQFDATLDDLVDVSMRGLARSRTLRSWNVQGLVTTGLLAGLPVFAIVQGTLGTRLMAGFGASLIAAAFYVITYKRAVEKRIRKLCLEQIGEDKPFGVEIELTELGIKVSQLKTQHIYDWSTVLEIEESEDAIYFHKRDLSSFAVRRRGFESKEHSEQFMEFARSHASAAQTE